MAKLDDKVQRLLIPASDIKLERELGSGGFGTVYAGTWRVVTLVAVKQLDVGFLTERTKCDIKREAYIHSEAHNHPNVCQVLLAAIVSVTLGVGGGVVWFESGPGWEGAPAVDVPPGVGR